MKRFFALFFLVLFLFLCACLGSFSPDEGAGALVFPHAQPVRNLCGSWGASCALFLFNALGFGAWGLLVPLFIGTILFACNGSIDSLALRVFGFILILCSVCASFAFFEEFEGTALPVGPGGYLGATLKFVTTRWFSQAGCGIFFVSIFLGGLILTCDYAVVRIALWCFGVMPIGNSLIEKLKGRNETPERCQPVFDDAIQEISEPVFFQHEQTTPREGNVTNIPDPQPEPEPIHVAQSENEEILPLQEEENPLFENENDNCESDDTVEDSVTVTPEEVPLSRNPFALPVKEKFVPEFAKPKMEISDAFKESLCEEFCNENEIESPEDDTVEEEPDSEEYDDTMIPNEVPDFEEPPQVEEEQTHCCEPAHAEIAEPNCEAFHDTTKSDDPDKEEFEPEKIVPKILDANYCFGYSEMLYSDYSDYGNVVCSDTTHFGGTVYADPVLCEDFATVNPPAPVCSEPVCEQKSISVESEESPPEKTIDEIPVQESPLPLSEPIKEEPEMELKNETPKQTTPQSVEETPVEPLPIEEPSCESVKEEILNENTVEEREHSEEITNEIIPENIFEVEPVAEEPVEEETASEEPIEEELYENPQYEEEPEEEIQWYDGELSEEKTFHEPVRVNYDDYLLPDIGLLTPSPPFNYEVFENTVKKQAVLLEKAFADFKCNVRVVEVQTGPVIAQFEIQLPKGLRLSKITNLSDDIASALKVPSVRILTSIPGKNTPGVEIPNEERQIVRLREVLVDTTETAKAMRVPIFLGKDASGSPMVFDMTKLPHLLIAGSTGTGKSVCINSIIMSILMTRTPREVRMILIDPKTVEMSSYKTIPHLLHPVVTDMKKAESILAWAVDKMEERYQLLDRAGVREIGRYNEFTEEELFNRLQPESEEEWNALPHTLPYLIIVVDEMSDLMMTTGKEVESHIIRLAQKSRGAGIHLILATQKPTVDVITGLIKSNLPARIAFKVTNQTDSRVVLDCIGAEKLLGSGDMLFLKPGTSQVLRGQGTYVSDQEIETVVEQLGSELQDFADELATLDVDEEDTIAEEAACGGEDAFYSKCVEQVIRAGRGSGSLLQRYFSVGYNRASRMIERMCDEGIVGPYNGSQAREVLITMHEWKRRQETRRTSPVVEEESEPVPKKQAPVNPTAVPRNNITKREQVKSIAAAGRHEA